MDSRCVWFETSCFLKSNLFDFVLISFSVGCLWFVNQTLASTAMTVFPVSTLHSLCFRRPALLEKHPDGKLRISPLLPVMSVECFYFSYYFVNISIVCVTYIYFILLMIYHPICVLHSR